MLWSFIGLIDLITLSYQDIKKNKWVDDRLNYFMMGATMMLLPLHPRKWWYVLIVAAVVIALAIFINKYKLLGEADVKSIAWIFSGLAYINPFSLIWFCIWLSGFTVIQHIAKKLILKADVRVPYYPIILISFGLTTWQQGLLI